LIFIQSAHAERGVLYRSIVGTIPMSDFDVCLSSAAIRNIVTDKIQEDLE
jgi:hypothetical protein